MNLNDDFSARVAVRANETTWVDSPMAGVQRKLLDRIGGEVARATSIVRYAPGSHFSPHVHTGGEEFLVLEGVFSDEHGDFPVGSYVRNPPQSSHTPGSEPGCTILVKLWQFDLDDRHAVKMTASDINFEADASQAGLQAALLHSDIHETVRVERWSPDLCRTIDLPGGAELFVIDGDFAENGEEFQRHDWLRLPAGYRLAAMAGPGGADIWIKTGHLDGPQSAPQVR